MTNFRSLVINAVLILLIVFLPENIVTHIALGIHAVLLGIATLSIAFISWQFDNLIKSKDVDMAEFTDKLNSEEGSFSSEGIVLAIVQIVSLVYADFTVLAAYYGACIGTCLIILTNMKRKVLCK